MYMRKKKSGVKLQNDCWMNDGASYVKLCIRGIIFVVQVD